MAIEREQNPVDVLFVGAGPASLAGAIHLSRLVKQHNEKVKSEGSGKALEEPMIAVLEKSAEIGYHGFSGAVMNPRGLRKLFPDFAAAGASGFAAGAGRTLPSTCPPPRKTITSALADPTTPIPRAPTRHPSAALPSDARFISASPSLSELDRPFHSLIHRQVL